MFRYSYLYRISENAVNLHFQATLETKFSIFLSQIHNILACIVKFSVFATKLKQKIPIISDFKIFQFPNEIWHFSSLCPMEHCGLENEHANY